MHTVPGILGPGALPARQLCKRSASRILLDEKVLSALPENRVAGESNVVLAQGDATGALGAHELGLIGAAGPPEVSALALLDREGAVGREAADVFAFGVGDGADLALGAEGLGLGEGGAEEGEEGQESCGMHGYWIGICG